MTTKQQCPMCKGAGEIVISTLAQYLQAFITANNKTQKDVSKETGIGQSVISRVLNDLGDMRSNNVVTIARYIGLTPQQLWDVMEKS